MLAPLLVGGAPPALAALAAAPERARARVFGLELLPSRASTRPTSRPRAGAVRRRERHGRQRDRARADRDGAERGRRARRRRCAPAAPTRARSAREARGRARARAAAGVFAVSAACVAAAGAVIARRFEVYGDAPRFVAVSAALERMRARRGDATYADCVFKITRRRSRRGRPRAAARRSRTRTARRSTCSPRRRGFVDPIWCANQPVYVPGCVGASTAPTSRCRRRARTASSARRASRASSRARRARRARARPAPDQPAQVRVRHRRARDKVDGGRGRSCSAYVFRARRPSCCTGRG